MKEAFSATTCPGVAGTCCAPLHGNKAMPTKNTGVAKAGHAGVYVKREAYLTMFSPNHFLEISAAAPSAFMSFKDWLTLPSSSVSSLRKPTP